MNAFLEKLKNPRNAALFAGLVGLLFGLFWAWVIQPVQFVDATPSYLRADLQEDYLRMTIDSFTVNGDFNQALKRWDALGPNAYQHLQSIVQNPGSQDPAKVLAFSQLIEAQRPQGAAPAEPAEQSSPLKAAAIIIVLLIVLGLVFFLLYKLLRKRNTGPTTAAQEGLQRSKNVEVVDYEKAGYDPPMAQFVTSYVIGDDLYDDSFSVESPSGEFLGECGMGISDTIGVGTDVKHVSAFEVWLFDKNDIQTVTKVLMSEHLFSDPASVQRLSEKGEPILAELKKQVVLETATLKIIATISDMAYGEGALPDKSYFEHFTVELAVWQKENPEPQILQ